MFWSTNEKKKRFPFIPPPYFKNIRTSHRDDGLLRFYAITSFLRVFFATSREVRCAFTLFFFGVAERGSKKNCGKVRDMRFYSFFFFDKLFASVCVANSLCKSPLFFVFVFPPLFFFFLFPHTTSKPHRTQAYFEASLEFSGGGILLYPPPPPPFFE